MAELIGWLKSNIPLRPMNHPRDELQILLVVFAAVLLVSTVFAWLAIQKAPEGSEDENGFHLS